jgi:hypothetical protein
VWLLPPSIYGPSRWLVLAVLLLAGCGNAPAGAAHPSPSSRADSSGAGTSSSPQAVAEPLFAVLEPGGDLTQMRNDVVAIVRVNGTARARASFKSRRLPQVGEGLTLPQPEGRVAAGRVYFADGTGVVRSLSPEGAVGEVARFPLATPQQALSFAVSPDGSRLMGVVLTFPPAAGSLGQAAASPPSEGYSLELFNAAAAGPMVTAQRKSWPPSIRIPGDLQSMVGWSSSSALASVDTRPVTQYRTEGRQIFGHVAEVDPAGKPGLMVGGSDCQPWTVLRDETALCDEGGSQKVSVRSRGGDVLFQLPVAQDVQYVNLTLSPDGSRVAYVEALSRKAFVVARDGARAELPAGFQPQGWLTSTTLIGVAGQGSGNMALVRLGTPRRVVDLGFKGFFVGVV